MISQAEPSDGGTLDVTVVYLTNFIAPDVLAICQNWSVRVRELIVLTSVAMEGNRPWLTDAGGLNVRVQKTWTRTKTDHHPGGYRDVNYVHVPIDTLRQLRQIQPSVVVSAELGVRSMLSAIHCAKTRWLSLHRRNCKLILAVSTSPWIEASRSGRLRTWQRKWLLRRADAVTYHGPQCRDWLVSLGVSERKLFLFQYAADPTKIHVGPIEPMPDASRSHIRILTVGQLIDRKGIREGLDEMIAAASALPAVMIDWTLLGDGPLMELLKTTPTPENLRLDFRGNVDASEIRDAYRRCEMMFFPTRGDEWGLVVDEALHSGLAVIGNGNAQSVVALIRDGHNGYIYEPGDEATLRSAISRYSSLPSDDRLRMRHRARESVRDRTPDVSAHQITRVIREIHE